MLKLSSYVRRRQYDIRHEINCNQVKMQHGEIFHLILCHLRFIASLATEHSSCA